MRDERTRRKHQVQRVQGKLLQSIANGQVCKALSEVAFLILGCVFVFSAITKAVNIPAASNHVGVFCSLMHLTVVYRYRVAVAVLLTALELSIGILSFFRRFRPYVIPVVVLVLVCFLALTFANYRLPGWNVESCGCFGELVHLSPRATFLKNVCLMVLALIASYSEIARVTSKS